MTEEFRPVKDYERYYVSDLGRVLNTETGKFLGLHDNGKGYLFVIISKNNLKKQFYIHRLVAQAFIPNPDNLDTVDHINGIKSDNRVVNLRWLSFHDNASRFYREQATEEQINRQSKPVMCIETGVIYKSVREATRKTGLPRYCISNVAHGKQAKTGGYTFRYL